MIHHRQRAFPRRSADIHNAASDGGGVYAASGFEARLFELRPISLQRKIGGGAGIGGGVLVYITGIPSLKQLRHCIVDGFDWNFSIMACFKEIAAASSAVGGIRELIRAIRAGVHTQDILNESVTTFKAISALSDGLSLGNKLSVTLVDIPLTGGGIDISIFGTSRTFTVRTIFEGDDMLWGIQKPFTKIAEA